MKTFAIAAAIPVLMTAAFTQFGIAERNETENLRPDAPFRFTDLRTVDIDGAQLSVERVACNPEPGEAHAVCFDLMLASQVEGGELALLLQYEAQYGSEDDRTGAENVVEHETEVLVALHQGRHRAARLHFPVVELVSFSRLLVVGPDDDEWDGRTLAELTVSDDLL